MARRGGSAHALGAVLLALALVAICTATGPAAAAQSGARTIHFQGEKASVPAGWPVYRLADHPRMCVRLDRKAVYLGPPGASQRCPAEAAVGPSRAILIEGRVGARASAAGGAGTKPIQPLAESDYTGLGFDACTAPSSRTMAAWADSPYRAIGVYIGGENRACSQSNLTSTWVGEQVAEGWHLIPTYVGLQAPTSVCGDCAKLSSGLATLQGRADARDAVVDAQAVAIGPGNPIYFDMEAYTRTTSATRATLTFLAAWTEQLHELGYVSGVYSSSASGIADIADQVGSDYPLPDDLWIANWNGQRNTLDPNVPATAWLDHQRIHQYRGGHNETWGGVTINIDNNYVEGATVGATAAAPVLPPLTVRHVKVVAGTVRLWVRCGWPEGETCPGRIVLRTQARLPLGAAPGERTRIARLAVGRRLFRLAGGNSHVFRLGLDSRGRPLLAKRGLLKAQLLVAIPGTRAVRAVRLRRGR